MGLGKGLEGNQRESVFDPGQSLNPVGDEMADIDIVGEVTFHQQIVLARCRMNFGYLLDFQRRGIGHTIGAAEFTFDLYEDRLHGATLSTVGPPCSS